MKINLLEQTIAAVNFHSGVAVIVCNEHMRSDILPLPTASMFRNRALQTSHDYMQWRSKL